MATRDRRTADAAAWAKLEHAQQERAEALRMWKQGRCAGATRRLVTAALDVGAARQAADCMPDGAERNKVVAAAGTALEKVSQHLDEFGAKCLVGGRGSGFAGTKRKRSRR